MERDDSTLRDIVITASVADDNSSGKGQNKKRKLHKAQFQNGKGLSYQVAGEKRIPGAPQEIPGQSLTLPVACAPGRGRL